MRTAFLAGLAVLAFATPAAAQTPTPTPDTTPTVAADGVGLATVTPDVASFAVYVSEQGRSTTTARNATNRVAKAIAQAATAAGVAPSDIRTVSVNISRSRVKPKRRPSYIRYTARQYLTFTVRDVTKIGPLMDAAADAGADNIEGPEYGFVDPSAGRLLATRAAIADARKRADDAAAQTGMRIVGVRSVILAPDGDDDSSRVQNLSSGGGEEEPTSGGGESDPTSVSSGTRQFVERVRVVFTAAPL
ncbi:SIMPL domain-containing protein [Solirubrobacter phytolaccae]|uniref:SIMPL domain-containing protein n=1 Tax=Solirubrobacter phytolaccae TaxID=1404360 RepID=A0A9X3NFC7_9ACTN|nr:SIMPL domain-containing protein [Solirubrobacter phytolaccae]MDA0183937.1 SIMPL domain-containing protein [Solirubrobacter phytolaccae]